MPNKRFVILTGATGTLGKAVCGQLLAEGYHPILVARDIHKLKALQQVHPEQVTVFACDVSDITAIDELFRQPFLQTGALCGVIACAGILTMGATANFAQCDWDAIMQTNLTGTFAVFKQAIPHMQPHGGSLIAIGSRWASGAKTATAYAASKAGLRGMIASMQKEYAGTNIRPVLISPGSIASPMSGSVNNGARPLDILQPEDVANTILHVLSSSQRVIFNEIIMLAYNYDLTDEYAV